MIHGTLAQFTTTLTNDFENVVTFQGDTTYTLNFVNHGANPNSVSVAQIPENAVLSNKHWLIKDEPIDNWKATPVKYLAQQGDRLVIKASASQLSVTVQGIEND